MKESEWHLICCVKKLKEKKNEKVKNFWSIFEVFDEIEREIEREKFERERSDSEKIWKREQNWKRAKRNWKKLKEIERKLSVSEKIWKKNLKEEFERKRSVFEREKIKKIQSAKGGIRENNKKRFFKKSVQKHQK